MLSPYRINANNVKKRSKKAKIDDIGDLKRPQMTLNNIETNSKESVKNKKNKLKGGSVEDNVEINEHCLDKILKKQWYLNSYTSIIHNICVFKWN